MLHFFLTGRGWCLFWLWDPGKSKSSANNMETKCMVCKSLIFQINHYSKLFSFLLLLHLLLLLLPLLLLLLPRVRHFRGTPRDWSWMKGILSFSKSPGRRLVRTTSYLVLYYFLICIILKYQHLKEKAKKNIMLNEPELWNIWAILVQWVEK